MIMKKLSILMLLLFAFLSCIGPSTEPIENKSGTRSKSVHFIKFEKEDVTYYWVYRQGDFYRGNIICPELDKLMIKYYSIPRS